MYLITEDIISVTHIDDKIQAACPDVWQFWVYEISC